MKKERLIYNFAGSLAATLVADCSAPAFAQGQGLDEMVVTARRREETLEATPISITAFTAEGLERRAINDLSEIASFAPNLNFDTNVPFSGSNVNAAVFIRGIGQNDIQLAVDPGVGVYVDGVYLSRSVGQTLELIDIERVEVLRGPQGTLFGRNTVGGALNITTRRPSDSFEGRFSAESGSNWDTRIRANVSGPLSESVRAGLSAMYRYRDNTIEGVGPDAPDLGERKAFSTRAQIDADLTSNLTLSLTGDATIDRSPSGSNVLIGYFPGSAFGEAHNFFFSGAPAICGDPTNAAYLTDTRCFNQQWVLGKFQSGSTFQTPASHQAIIEAVQGRPFEPQSELTLWGASATFDWNPAENLEVKSITAVRSVDANSATDADHSPHLIVHTIDKFNTLQVTQELQVLGESFNNRLNWIVGGYYYFEDGENLQVNDTNLTMFRSGSIIDTKSYSAFAQATLDVTDRFSVTGGLRWTDETKTFNAGDEFRILADFGLGIPAGTPLVPVGSTAESHYSKVTPMGSVSYKASDELLLYATYSQGLKGGGFTQNIFPPLPAIPTFDPEQLDNYEAGFKFFGFNNRLRINGAGFFGDYKDVQIVVIEGVAPTVRNAAGGEIKGFELEMEAAVTDALRVEGGVGYLDAKYTEVSGAAAAIGVTENNRFVNAPEWTTNLGVSYRFETEFGSITPRVDWSYRSLVYNDALNSSLIAQPGYHIVNLLLNYESPDGNWGITGGVRNVTDETYIITGYVDPVGIGTSEGVYDIGRRYFISTRFSF